MSPSNNQRRMKAIATKPRSDGFTVLEVMLASTLTVMLVMLLSSAWSGLVRPHVDVIQRCRLMQSAHLATASLARDFGGTLAGESGDKFQSRMVGRLLVFGSQLWLCFDGGSSPNGQADWAAPDTVIIYEVQANKLLRTNQATGTTFTVATCVNDMHVIELGDGVQIDLTLNYRELTRMHTLIAKDP